MTYGICFSYCKTDDDATTTTTNYTRTHSTLAGERFNLVVVVAHARNLRTSANALAVYIAEKKTQR